MVIASQRPLTSLESEAKERHDEEAELALSFRLHHASGPSTTTPRPHSVCSLLLLQPPPPPSSVLPPPVPLPLLPQLSTLPIDSVNRTCFHSPEGLLEPDCEVCGKRAMSTCSVLSMWRHAPHTTALTPLVPAHKIPCV